MAKEKNFNPVQAAKKAEKQKQIKKQKANVQAQRNEKLARRNPHRIQRDIDNLKELEKSGDLRPHDRQKLLELEKDLVAVNKARAALGDKAPQFKPDRSQDGGERGGRGGGRGRGGVLGKRSRDGNRKDSDGESSDTDSDVDKIPMPRDTPPPIPKRRDRHSHAEQVPDESKKPVLVYEAAPQIRDLRKEATQFMPTAVAQKMKLAKGEGRLLEPEEYDELQKAGYLDSKSREEAKEDQTAGVDANRGAHIAAENVAEAAAQEAEHLMVAAAAEEALSPKAQGAVAENKLRHVEMEEVEDEDL
ncbi:hypothetical protein BS50DRAFT_599422 [Corynespora cassiicola Philippines]|uniref:Wbp11/ELF5/Saf1 N-terminal domain-containing protein n=1 Tax=Corynespora cassiicola Philippines TaxID=1448308 RepID=A0A2T2NUG5_CORCC|nr:hypothetical protein BS50DRAFT_599422 [Corynespora cassiicola Philippines]